MKTIDLTPTWESMLPFILLSRDNIKEKIAKTGAYTPKQQENLKLLESELKKMAQLADKWVEHMKSPNKITITDEQKVEFFYNALCNGLAYVESGYGLELTWSDEAYTKSRWKLVQTGSTPCLEDILIRILEDDGFLTMVDHEGGKEPAMVNKNRLLERMDNVPQDRLKQMLDEEDDAETAIVIIQTVFFNEIIFG